MAQIALPSGSGGAISSRQRMPAEKRTLLDNVLLGLDIAGRAYGIYADTQKVAMFQKQKQQLDQELAQGELMQQEQKLMAQGQYPTRRLTEAYGTGKARPAGEGEQGIPLQTERGLQQVMFPGQERERISTERMKTWQEIQQGQADIRQKELELKQQKLSFEQQRLAAGQKERAISRDQYNAKLAMQMADKAEANASRQKGAVSSRLDAIRKEYNASPVTKDTMLRRMQWGNIDTVPDTMPERSPADDIKMIFSYMKMLDPTSTVREGEFATAQNAGAVDDKIYNLYNNVVRGNRLNDSQIKEFKQSAFSLYQSQAEQQKAVDERYINIARQLDPQVRPELVIDPSLTRLPSRQAPARQKKQIPPAILMYQQMSDSPEKEQARQLLQQQYPQYFGGQ